MWKKSKLSEDKQLGYTTKFIKKIEVSKRNPMSYDFRG